MTTINNKIAIVILVSVTLIVAGSLIYYTYFICNDLFCPIDTITPEKNQSDVEETYTPPTPKETQLPSTQEPTLSSPTPKETKKTYERIEVSTDDDPILGSKDAPVTIVDFSNFQCPACAKFATEILPLIKEEYINTGKVKLVYRDIFVVYDEYSQIAAEAGECADDQGKFWEYHDILFEKQTEWSITGETKLKEYAQNLGLDMIKFNECLNSEKYANETQKDLIDAINYGVKATPTIYINGIKVEGAQPYNVYKELIEQELNQ